MHPADCQQLFLRHLLLRKCLLQIINACNYGVCCDHSPVTPMDPKDFHAQAGARIRELRASRLTQEELANASGLSRMSLVNLESGRQKLLLHQVFAISAALGITPHEFIRPLFQDDMAEFYLSSAGDAMSFVQDVLSQIEQSEPSIAI